jgi:hypothetical protein
VGYTQNSPWNFPLVVTLSGGTWSATSDVPLPANADPSVHLSSESTVACDAATLCITIGGYRIVDDGHSNLSESFFGNLSGSTWTANEAPLPADADTSAGGTPTAAACTGNGCWVVGSYRSTNGSSSNPGLIETYG